MMVNFILVSRPANKGKQFLEPLGTLSNYDDGGRENITKKMNLRQTLSRLFGTPTFPGVEFLSALSMLK